MPAPLAQGYGEIAPLIAQAAGSSPPLLGRQSLAIIVDTWHPPSRSRRSLGGGYEAGAVASTPAPLPGSATQALTVASWTAPYFIAQGYGRIAPIVPVAATPDAPPVRANAYQQQLLAWYFDPVTVISLASFAGQAASADAPPPNPGVALQTIRAAWAVEYPRSQGYSRAASIGGVVVTPDQPPVPGRQTLTLTVAAWQPPLFIAQGYGDMAPYIAPPVAPDAPPVLSKVTANIVLATWQVAYQPVEVLDGIAAFTVADQTAPPATTVVPAGKRRRYYVEIDGQDFPVDSAAQAVELLQRARAIAEHQAESKASVAEKRLRHKPSVPTVKLAPPVITASPALEAEIAPLVADIERLYARAAETAELRLLMLKQLEAEAEDDDDDVLLLI